MAPATSFQIAASNMSAMSNMTYDPSPVVTTYYFADPSAHVFNDTIYIYPSHDRNSTVNDTANGGAYDMVDYQVVSLQNVPGTTGTGLATVYPVGITLEQVPWASKQLWAPDAAQGADGRYYLYMPAKDQDDIFRIGVAHSDQPEGPFTAEQSYIPGSYSIDPCSFVDDSGSAYLFFGGIWGGQLQKYSLNNGNWTYNATAPDEPVDQSIPAIGPRVASLNQNMLTFSSNVTEIQILSANGSRLLSSDHERRFFEAPWVHKYNGTYYLSYSTGDTHFIVYATSPNPMGPYTYRGRILEPVQGWTTHQSIFEFRGKWYIAYADASLSGGVGRLRSTKIREVLYNAQGEIMLAQPQPVLTTAQINGS